MKRRPFRFWLSLGLSLASAQGLAATASAPSQEAQPIGWASEVKIAGDPAQMSRATEPTASPAPGAPAASAAAIDKSAKIPRLRFRGKDGTCACDCASGGTSEAEIKKAQEAREHASR
jgi:hypothetical protein